MADLSTQQKDLLSDTKQFSGNLFFFHAFDIGEDINLEKVEKLRTITTVPLSIPKYFKTYYSPLVIELPHPHDSARCASVKLHSFGVISFSYKVPFNGSFEELRKDFNDIYNNYFEQSIIDAKSVFRRIEKCILKPKFFYLESAYSVIQVDPEPHIDINSLEQQYGSIITSTLRFETEALSEEQKKDILDDAIDYFHEDLIIVDRDASFVYDAEYEEIIDFFEFSNLQQLELRYFDGLLDKQLTQIYNQSETTKLPLRAYLPFAGAPSDDPVTRLSKLRVDISVITERLESSIKLAGEPYFSDLYNLLVKKLDLKNWHESIERKLDIMREVQSIYQDRIDNTREDMLSVLVILLIFIELIVGILSYLK